MLGLVRGCAHIVLHARAALGERPVDVAGRFLSWALRATAQISAGQSFSGQTVEENAPAPGSDNTTAGTPPIDLRDVHLRRDHRVVPIGAARSECRPPRRRPRLRFRVLVAAFSAPRRPCPSTAPAPRTTYFSPRSECRPPRRRLRLRFRVLVAAFSAPRRPCPSTAPSPGTTYFSPRSVGFGGGEARARGCAGDGGVACSRRLLFS